MSAEAATMKIMSTSPDSEKDRKGSDGATLEQAWSAEQVRCAEAERPPLLQGMLKVVEGCPQRTCEQLWKRNGQVQRGGQCPSLPRLRAQAKHTCPLARKKRPVFVSRAYQYLFCDATVRGPRPAQCGL